MHSRVTSSVAALTDSSATLASSLCRSATSCLDTSCIATSCLTTFCLKDHFCPLLCAELSHIFCPLFIKFYRLYYCLQITKSQERGSNIHDPSMITVPPVEQYTNRYIFNAPYFSGGNSQLQVCRVFTCRESTELTFYIYIRIVFSTLVYPATCL